MWIQRHTVKKILFNPTHMTKLFTSGIKFILFFYFFDQKQTKCTKDTFIFTQREKNIESLNNFFIIIYYNPKRTIYLK